MFDNARVLDLLERAIDDDPMCRACGSPNTIEDDGAGRLCLVCPTTIAPAGLAARVSAALLPHTRRRLLDLTEHVAA